MKYLIEWILKGLLTISLGAVAVFILILIALIMWDSRFVDMAENIKKYIWGGD
jgi:hypothetical protein